MRTDRIPPALHRLDPERRALLELSFLRDVPDGEIAELLGVSAADISRRREEGLGRLSDALGLEATAERRELADQLSAMPAEAWGAGSGARAGSAAGTAPATSPAGARPGVDRWRATLRTAIVIAAMAAIGVAVVASSRDGAFTAAEPRGSGRDSAATPADRPRQAARAELKPVANGRGRGVVRLVPQGPRERLLVSVRGLEPPGAGTYVVWLYRAVDDAKAIGGSALGSFRLSAPLPRNAARYRALDISLEPRDGNELHGGGSVLRAPLAPLRAGG